MSSPAGSTKTTPLNEASIGDEGKRLPPAAVDTHGSESYAQQNADLIVESLLTPILRRNGGQRSQ